MFPITEVYGKNWKCAFLLWSVNLFTEDLIEFSYWLADISCDILCKAASFVHVVIGADIISRFRH